MDELEEKKRILLKNKHHILRMPNNKKKVDMLQAYFSLLEFHRFMTDRDGFDAKLYIDDEFTSKFDRYIINSTDHTIKELENNTNLLLEKLQTIIDIYKENDFCKFQHIELKKINSRKMIKAIYDFFDNLDQDVLKIYCDMACNNNIYLNSSFMDRLGYSMDSTPIDNACITIQNIPNYLDFYLTLAHEVGHCFQFYLQKTQRTCSSFDPYCEITSILFEKLFLKYLKTNCFIKDDSSLNLEYNIGFLTSVSISKELCKVLIKDKKCIIDPFNLSFKSKITSDEIKKAVINDCGYIKPFDTKANFVEFHYVFGTIIADYFFDKLMKDFDNEWINFKNFICTVKYLSMEEVINEYFDMNKIEKDIKVLTKSYLNR